MLSTQEVVVRVHALCSQPARFLPARDADPEPEVDSVEMRGHEPVSRIPGFVGLVLGTGVGAPIAMGYGDSYFLLGILAGGAVGYVLGMVFSGQDSL